MVGTDVLAGRILFRIANLGHKFNLLLISLATLGYERDAEFSDSSALLPGGGLERSMLKGGFKKWMLEGSQVGFSI